MSNKLEEQRERNNVAQQETSIKIAEKENLLTMWKDDLSDGSNRCVRDLIWFRRRIGST